MFYLDHADSKDDTIFRVKLRLYCCIFEKKGLTIIFAFYL